MKGLVAIILGLLLSLGLFAGATANAAEIGAGACIIASAEGCSFVSKSDDSKAPQSKGSFTCHGCHGHHIVIPLGSEPEVVPIVAARIESPRSSTSLSPPTHSDTFRPPIA